MPVQYRAGVMAEHIWCREKAGLFDVSHMGQIHIPRAQAAALEGLLPSDVLGLPNGRQRYGLLTNDAGGVRDDLMIARYGDDLVLVVNAACAESDFSYVSAHIGDAAVIENRALIAVQGPMAERSLSKLVPEASKMRFMDALRASWQGSELWLTRSGYTGEDGFEISLEETIAEAFAKALLQDESVAPIGLGARDSLRLEAALPLYGQDLKDDITPVEAGLSWAISKIRRVGGERTGGFAGADVILEQLVDGAPRRSVGLRPKGKAPMRTGVSIYASAEGSRQVGLVTSGGFGPSLGAPISLALVGADIDPDAPLWGEVRGKRLPVDQCATPFLSRNFKR